MSFFQFLPDILKYSVIQSVDLQDSLKLLQVTKSLRYSLLKNGVFPKKLKLFSFRPKCFFTENGEIFVKRVLINLDNDFSVSIDDLSRNANFNLIWKNFRYCKTVDLWFDVMESQSINQRRRKSFQKLKALLPKLEKVGNLYLISQDFAHLPLIFDHFRPFVYEMFALEYNDEFDDVNSVANSDALDRAYFLNLLQERLSYCKRIILDLPLNFFYDEFTKIPFRMVENSPEDWSDFKKDLRLLINRGIPSRFPTPVSKNLLPLEEGIDLDEAIREFAKFEKILLKETDLQILSEYSEEGEKLVKVFLENYHDPEYPWTHFVVDLSVAGNELKRKLLLKKRVSEMIGCHMLGLLVSNRSQRVTNYAIHLYARYYFIEGIHFLDSSL